MNIRFNGWQRLGIVLSVCWAIGAGYWTLGQTNWAADSYGFCMRLHDDWGPCKLDFAKNWPAAVGEQRAEAAFNALAPIPLAWLLAYLVLGITRWVRRGFQS
jgi:hypothetical protein